MKGVGIKSFLAMCVFMSVGSTSASEAISNQLCPANALALGANLFLYDTDAFRNTPPFFGIVGQNFQLKSEESRNLCPITYVTGDNVFKVFGDCLAYKTGLKEADYSFVRASSLPYSGPAVYTGNNDYVLISSSTRRMEYVSAAFKISEFEDITGTPTALCDADKMYWQSAPTIRLVSRYDDRQSIQVTVSGTYDKQFSRFAISGQPAYYIYTFGSVDYPGTQYKVTTTSSSINYSPEITGDYRVFVQYYDGTYSATVNAGIFYYEGGRRPARGEIR